MNEVSVSPPGGDDDGGLDRGSGVALWRQIEQILEHEISTGRFRPGSRMATEQDLARRFKVNRHTIRRALADLQENGLIRIEQGRGTFVHEDLVDYPVGRRTRFSENLIRQSRVPVGTMLRGLELPAEPLIARALSLEVGTPILVLDSAGEADGVRVSVSSRYYPKALADGLIELYAETLSVTESLRRLGIEDYYRQYTRVTARLPSSEDARYLHQPKTRPVLVTESLSVDPQGRPLEYGLTRFASDRIQLVVEG
jgi:GntR family phosphonate transport system transcriptional regulator